MWLIQLEQKCIATVITWKPSEKQRTTCFRYFVRKLDGKTVEWYLNQVMRKAERNCDSIECYPSFHNHNKFCDFPTHHWCRTILLLEVEALTKVSLYFFPRNMVLTGRTPTSHAHFGVQCWKIGLLWITCLCVSWKHLFDLGTMGFHPTAFCSMWGSMSHVYCLWFSMVSHPQNSLGWRGP